MQNYNLSPANMQLIEKMKDQNPKRERELEASSKPLDEQKKGFNKKKLIYTIGAVAALSAVVFGGILLAKKGKIPCFNNSKIRPEAPQKPVDGQNIDLKGKQDTIPPLDEEKLFEKQQDMILGALDNPKAGNLTWYKHTPTCLSKTSVNDDILLWKEKLKNTPCEVEVKGREFQINNKADLLDLDKISAHNYEQTSDIFIQTRAHNTGFPKGGFAIQDNKLVTMSEDADFNWFLDTAFDKSSDNYGVTSGLAKDGKAFVVVHFREQRQDVGNRPAHTYVVLRSKTDKFNQDQLDLINMFQNLSQDKITKDCPLGLSFLIPEEDAFKPRNIDTSLEFNKNMFLSIIKHYADKNPDFEYSSKTAKKLYFR